MPQPFSAVTFPRNIARTIHDDEVFMEFHEDEDATHFQQWWESQGAQFFAEWKERQPLTAASAARMNDGSD